jgi:hypothetical protein
MNKILPLISVLFLVGCEATVMDKARQDVTCEDHGGVYAYANPYSLVRCNDGHLKDWIDVRGEKVVKYVEQHRQLEQ